MDTIVKPASGGTAGAQPQDATVEAFVALRWAYPWRTRVRWGDDAPEVEAKAVYERYRAETEAAGFRPLSHVDFGVALQAVPGITRTRIPAGHVYTGITVETRQERAEAEVRRSLFSGAMAARADHPGHALWSAHHTSHAMALTYCDHEPSQLDVIALLAEVEAEVADQLSAAVEAKYGPWLRWQPGEPDPGIAIYRAQDEAERDRIVAKIAALQAEDAAEDARLRAPYDAAYPAWQAAVDAIVPPVTRCRAETCETSEHWTIGQRQTFTSAYPPYRTKTMVVGGGHTDWFSLPENAAHRESYLAARALQPPPIPQPPGRIGRKREYDQLRRDLEWLERSLARATSEPEPVEDAAAAY